MSPPTIADVPAEIFDPLKGARPDVLIASRDELDRLGAVLAHDQLARLQTVEPILIVLDRADRLKS